MDKDNPVKDKSYHFALNIIKAARRLSQVDREFDLSRQLLRSGTSIGANIHEATAAQSKNDFTAKMAIASKEARESHYWLRLLKDSELLAKDTAEDLINGCEELMRLLTSIVKTSQLRTKH